MLPLILLVAFGLRFWDLSVLPNGLHWDEMDTGYQAYSLLKTGKDYFANPLPFFIHSFADFRTPVFIYSAVPSVAVLGLSPLSVRLPALIWGLIAIAGLYLLVYQLFHSRFAATASALTLSFSLWHFIYSRKSVETGSLLALTTIAVALFLRGLHRPRYLILSGLIFAASAAAYSPGKLFIPLLVTALIIIYRHRLSTLPRKFLAASFMLFSLLVIPIYWDSLFGQSGLRLSQLAVWTDPTSASTVDYQRLQFALSTGRPKEVGMQPQLLDRLLYNKPVLWISRIAANYLTTFSTEFLFTQGDPEPRHSPGKDTIGMLHVAEATPLILGLIFLAAHIKRPSFQLILAWLLLAPLPSALTRDGGNHAARLLILLPALILAISAGLYRLSSRKFLFAAYCLVFAVTAFFDLAYFFTRYRHESAKPYQWGFPQAVQLAQAASPQYAGVILDFHDDTALMAWLFTTRLDPATFQALLPLTQVHLTDQLEGLAFGNVFLLNPGSRRWTDITLPGRYLVISSADQILLDTLSPKLDTISYPDTSPAFYVFER